MGYVTKEEIECTSCGRIIRKNELQYDSPEGRVCVNCYTGKQPRGRSRITYSQSSSTFSQIGMIACIVVGVIVLGLGLWLCSMGVANIEDEFVITNNWKFGAGLAVACIGLFVALAPFISE